MQCGTRLVSLEGAETSLWVVGLGVATQPTQLGQDWTAVGSKGGCLCLAQSWASCPAQNHATLALSVSPGLCQHALLPPYVGDTDRWHPFCQGPSCHSWGSGPGREPGLDACPSGSVVRSSHTPNPAKPFPGVSTNPPVPPAAPGAMAMAAGIPVGA